MITLLVILGVVALLVLALEPARRRQDRSAPPFTRAATADRDVARTRVELGAARQREEAAGVRMLRMLGAAGGAVPFHSAPMVPGHDAELDRLADRHAA